MAGGRIAQAAGGPMIDAVPDGEVQLVVMFHLVGLVQRAEHFLRQAEVGVPQGAGAQRVGDGDRQQGGADAVTADVQEVEREVLGIDPVVAERVSAELGGRNEPPVDRERLGDRRRQDRAHVALGVAQLPLQPVVGPQQRFARFGQLAVGLRVSSWWAASSFAMRRASRWLSSVMS